MSVRFLLPLLLLGCSDTLRDSCPSPIWTSVSAGYAIACGVHDDGCVSCWGNQGVHAADTGYRQWADVGDDEPPEGVAFTKVAVDPGGGGYGGYPTCGIRTDGTLACWGSHFRPYPSDDLAVLDVAVSLGICAVGVDGVLTCWGLGPEDEHLQSWVGPYVSVDINKDGTLCALTTAGAIDCMGGCFNESICHPPSGSFTQLTVGASACALDSDGQTTCWSNVSFVPNTERFQQISSYDQLCGVRTDGTLYCWWGDGSRVRTPPAGTFKMVDVGDNYACAIRTDGELVCWGEANYGQLNYPR